MSLEVLRRARQQRFHNFRLVYNAERLRVDYCCRRRRAAAEGASRRCPGGRRPRYPGQQGRRPVRVPGAKAFRRPVRWCHRRRHGPGPGARANADSIATISPARCIRAPTCDSKGSRYASTSTSRRWRGGTRISGTMRRRWPRARARAWRSPRGSPGRRRPRADRWPAAARRWRRVDRRGARPCASPPSGSATGIPCTGVDACLRAVRLIDRRTRWWRRGVMARRAARHRLE
jgi:hypothetical protein